MGTEAGEPDEVPDLRQLFGRLAVAMVLLVVVAYGLSSVLQEPMQAVSDAFVARFGLAGVFLGVAILDAIPGTFHEPLLILAFDGGVNYGLIVAVAGTASVLAGVIGWGCGRALGRWSVMDRLMLKYRIGPFMRRYGGWAVAVAAITPFPYAITTWGAGAAEVPLSTLIAGSLVRYIKVALYLGLIASGWSLGA